MLAIYDFEESKLQLAEKEDFNQSKLYDRLFKEFTIRQLEKDTDYIHLNKEEEAERIEFFRLRLGIVAFMMFLNDKTNHSSNKLCEELNGFELSNENINSNEIIGGFFFIHENKATKENGEKLFNFEFLHKTFGEFLAADFLLRIAAYRGGKTSSRRKLSKEGTFRFCFGHNWLHKHPKILSFVIEHSSNILENHEKEIELFIKDELENAFDKNTLMFPNNELNFMKPLPVIEHLAIYTQNLIILWTCIAKEFEFKLNSSLKVKNSIKNSSYFLPTQNPDDDDNLTIITWKRMTNLWKTVGNAVAIAKIGEWIDVELKNNKILITNKNKEVNNYTQTAAQISLNDYELIISYNHSAFRLEDLPIIINRKPQLKTIAIELINNRFEYLLVHYKPKNIEKLMEDILHNESGGGYAVNSYIQLLIKLAKISTKYFKEMVNILNKKNNYLGILTIDIVELIIKKGQYEILYRLLEENTNFNFHPKIEFRIIEVLINKFKISHRLVEFSKDNKKLRSISLNDFYRLTVLLFEYLPERQKDISLFVLDKLYERSHSGRSLTADKRVKLLDLVIGRLGVTQQRLDELRGLYHEEFERLAIQDQLLTLELLATYIEDRQFVLGEITKCYDYLSNKILTNKLKIDFLTILLRFFPESLLTQKIAEEFIYDGYPFRDLGVNERNRLYEVILAYAPDTKISTHVLTEIKKYDPYK